MPPNTVSVCRPGAFGNPFDWRTYGRAAAVDFFRAWLAGELTDAERASLGFGHWPEAVGARAAILDRLPALRGKNLACWCPPEAPCHADVLLELANR